MYLHLGGGAEWCSKCLWWEPLAIVVLCYYVLLLVLRCLIELLYVGIAKGLALHLLLVVMLVRALGPDAFAGCMRLWIFYGAESIMLYALRGRH